MYLAHDFVTFCAGRWKSAPLTISDRRVEDIGILCSCAVAGNPATCLLVDELG